MIEEYWVLSFYLEKSEEKNRFVKVSNIVIRNVIRNMGRDLSYW